jgi:hypothetical protein
MSDVEIFEQTLEHLLEWNTRQALELDCKNPDLIAYKNKLDIMNKMKKELVDMFKNKK